jgi:hypothetical protein
VKRAILTILAGLVIWLGIEMALHPLADSFGIGVYPAPNGTPWTYQLLSGFLPALTALTLVSVVSGAWHKYNCHHTGCLRIGRHTIAGTPWCNLHHEEARPAKTEIELLERIVTLLEGQLSEPQ